MLRGDTILRIALAAAALFVIIIVAGLAAELYLGSAQSIFKFGPSFLVGSKWQPSNNVFNALPFVYGTLLTSAIAIVIGFPISLGIAVFISEKLKGHQTFGYSLGTIVDLLAAVPSVIYGLWGVFVLIPLLRDYVERPLHKSLGFITLFSGHPFGYDFLTAGIILSNNDYSNNVSSFTRCFKPRFLIVSAKQCIRLALQIGKLRRKAFYHMHVLGYLVRSF